MMCTSVAKRILIMKCTKFGPLILRKIIKILATRCYILRLKCTKFDFGWGSTPDPDGELTAPPDLLAGFKGLLLREGREGEEERGGRKARERGREGKGKEIERGRKGMGKGREGRKEKRGGEGGRGRREGKGRVPPF